MGSFFVNPDFLFVIIPIALILFIGCCAFRSMDEILYYTVVVIGFPFVLLGKVVYWIIKGLYLLFNMICLVHIRTFLQDLQKYRQKRAHRNAMRLQQFTQKKPSTSIPSSLRQQIDRDYNIRYWQTRIEKKNLRMSKKAL